jgi:hypothetical protein
VSAEAISAIIGVATFFLTCLGNALILGLFLGGIKAEMRLNSDRLAKIEGMFTLVPRRGDNQDGQVLPLGMVCLGSVVSSLGIPPDLHAQRQVHA